jgi:addiction module HigA family antidote
MIYDHPHPGEIIKADILEPLELSQSAAALTFSIAPAYLSQILNGATPMSEAFAIHLEKCGFSTKRAWVNLQKNFDSWVERHPDERSNFP